MTTATKLISNEGNVMLTVTADSCGRHDTSAGACSCESNTVRFGHETKYLHACRENFIVEVTKHGMSKRDIVPNINFFMNVPCVISNCPQINNPCNGFNPTPIRVLIWNDKT